MNPELLGGIIAGRKIHFALLLDGSTSITGEKAQSLNFAVADAIREMRQAAAKNVGARVSAAALYLWTPVSSVEPDTNDCHHSADFGSLQGSSILI